MTTIEGIRTDNERLSLEERAQIIAGQCGWTGDDWDRQMEGDAAAGKFAGINFEADAASAAGQTHPLSESLGEP